ncbi:aminotransferase-like domain-containing protein [Acinetobacter stercoris]|uniref:Putative HTH-type transcriptional regulator YdcR n=1 Tax=Acinetobacter stercoris TaxID=2126983 RepID=A0A2U3N222_9GAMM|nr:PLP-dependent aminotransferase family protein [Acinetobacter stercoris]SPL71665.1 putative HTH-type transcriptional regulator YdcR [Acinetobacter stercoris]
MKTKIDIVISHIKEQIDNKKLISGSRLPSVRQLAKKLGFSVSTVVEAYARMQAELIIESRAGSGYYVSGVSEIPVLESVVQYEREIDPLWISRQSLEAKNEIYKPGCGWLPSDWMSETSVRKGLKQALKLDSRFLTDYPAPQGHSGLRKTIAQRKKNQDIHVNMNQILLTDSGTQAIDLVFRHLLNAGDVILVDDPCYFNFQALIKVHQLQYIAVPFTENGPDLHAFEKALQLKPKLYLTNSGIHNPTGACLSIQHAYQIAKMAEQANLVIIEDDIFADFEFIAAPRYAALAGFQHVIQIGSFSKTLSASIRTGYIISHQDQIEELINLRIATNFSCNHLNAEIIYHILNDTNYIKSIERLKIRLNKAMKETINKLEKYHILPWTIPKAGLFLWCHLPENIDAAELSKFCLKHGVILAPGNSFSHSSGASQFMRFNIAQMMHQKIFDVIEAGIHHCLDHDAR